ncbi:hypothetical protein LDENG_00173610 [Lucifuga dentata]|nr:hypothetical protein LDENG_00173610 [Lucifuga dentata]
MPLCFCTCGHLLLLAYHLSAFLPACSADSDLSVMSLYLIVWVCTHSLPDCHVVMFPVTHSWIKFFFCFFSLPKYYWCFSLACLVIFSYFSLGFLYLVSLCGCFYVHY